MAKRSTRRWRVTLRLRRFRLRGRWHEPVEPEIHRDLTVMPGPLLCRRDHDRRPGDGLLSEVRYLLVQSRIIHASERRLGELERLLEPGDEFLLGGAGSQC